jgi:hypothetical protein
MTHDYKRSGTTRDALHKAGLLDRDLCRGAIADSFLERFEDGRVSFGYRGGRTGETERCTLTAEQFITRFLQHVLPRRFSPPRSRGPPRGRCRSCCESAFPFRSESRIASGDRRHRDLAQNIE